MKSFELQFQILEVSHDVLDEVIAAIDSGYASHGNIHLLTVWAEAESAIEAAIETVSKLAGLHVQVVRLYEDLVTRQDIADRTSTTRQAVGNWVRQDRRAEGNSPFPDPYNVVGGGVWLWSEVNEWLSQAGKDDGLAHPTARDYDIINAALRTHGLPDQTSNVHLRARDLFVKRDLDEPPVDGSVSFPRGVRYSFHPIQPADWTLEAEGVTKRAEH